MSHNVSPLFCTPIQTWVEDFKCERISTEVQEDQQ